MSVPAHQRILPHMDISEQGLRELEIWLLRRGQELQWGPWIYVGTFPVDLDTTSISPAFENGWRNTGGGQQRLRFRRTVPTSIRKVQSLEIEGDVSNSLTLTNSVIFTLPAGYRPSENSGYVVAANTDGDVVLWQVESNGEVTYVDLAAAGGGGGVTSVSESGDTPLVGDVTFSEGANITLTQVGQDIEITAAADSFDQDLLPWLVDVDVFATSVSQTNWDTLNQGDDTQVYGFAKVSSGVQNDQINWDIVLAAGTWSLELMHVKFSNRGIYTVDFDGVSVGTIDGYDAGIVVNARSSISGIAVAAAGKVRVKLLMATKNGSSSSYYGSIQHLRLERTA